MLRQGGDGGPLVDPPAVGPVHPQPTAADDPGDIDQGTTPAPRTAPGPRGFRGPFPQPVRVLGVELSQVVEAQGRIGTLPPRLGSRTLAQVTQHPLAHPPPRDGAPR